MIYDTINPEVIRFILEDIKTGARVLDIGCGTGKLGKFLKAETSCFLTGLEIDKEAAFVAKEFYDEILIMDLEDFIKKSCEFRNGDKYDFIIFGDILEHVTNSEVLLRCFAKNLKKEGYLIVSIPNVANWLVRLKLLFGNFDYSGGIQDQGHLRFFTYKTSKKLLQDSGYKVVSVKNNNGTRALRLLGRFYKSMFAFQFVFKCRRIGDTG